VNRRTGMRASNIFVVNSRTRLVPIRPASVRKMTKGERGTFRSKNFTNETNFLPCRSRTFDLPSRSRAAGHAAVESGILRFSSSLYPRRGTAWDCAKVVLLK